MNARSLILVTVDCLRADHVGFLGYARPTTPFLDSLAHESTIFSNAIVAGAPTYFSFPAIMASRYPLALGRDVVGIAPGEPTIATQLQAAGYATAAFIAGNPYLTSRFGYDQGFDEFRDFLEVVPRGEGVLSPTNSAPSELNRRIRSLASRTPLTAASYEELYFRYCQRRAARENIPMDTLRRYPAAHIVIDEVLSWLGKIGDRPFFLWIHLMDPHHPYYPPEEALAALGTPMPSQRARFLNSFWVRENLSVRRLRRYRDDVISLYDAGIHWVDRQLARLVHELKQKGRWDQTAFALTADHGEEFLEHGNRYHSPVNLHESLIKVPLLLHAPGTTKAQSVNAPFSLVHLAPTLVEAVGLKPGGGFSGGFKGHTGWPHSPANALPDQPAIVECLDGCNNPLYREDRLRPRLLAVRDRNLKLVMNFRDKTDSLYDLERDPDENSPLPSNALAKERGRLVQIARDHVQSLRTQRDAQLRLRARMHELRQLMPEKIAAPKLTHEHSAV
jgi:arylsulfatase A-like enzyme